MAQNKKTPSRKLPLHKFVALGGNPKAYKGSGDKRKK